MSRMPYLCIAGGGTGGHVMPALALADAARNRWPELEVQFIGATRGLEARLLPERGEKALLLTMHAVQGAGLLQRLRVVAWELPKAVLRILGHWRSNRPGLVVGVGGYASATGVVAALLSRIPVVLYEQNAVPGMVNRRLARFCDRIMLGFAEAAPRLPQQKCVVTGNIVRPAIRNTHHRPHTPPRLLVLGGSQGARFLNETVPHACGLLQERGHAFAVSHVAGSDEAAATVAGRYGRYGIEAEVLPYCDDMPDFYGSGDLMLARAGAMTVGEAASCGMPTIFVPLPHAADQHQRFNAESLAAKGGAVVVEQQQTTAESLAALLEYYLFDGQRLRQMSAAALAAAPAEAEARQVEVLAAFLRPQEVTA